MKFQKNLLFTLSGLFLISSSVFGDDIALEPNTELLEQSQAQLENTPLFVGEGENRDICLFPIKLNKTRSLKKHLNLTKKNSYKNNSAKVLLLRNPWDRAFAMYKLFIKQENRKISGSESLYESSSEIYKTRHNVSKSFLLYLSGINQGLINPKDIFQYTALKQFDVSLEEIDYIFFVDTLNADLQHFSRQENLKYSPINLQKKATYKNVNVMQLVNSNSKIKELLNTILKKDIKLYRKAKLMNHHQR